MAKIPMKNAVAELDGDEMTRVLWDLIKERLLAPFVELKTEYFDLSLKNRDTTEDRVTYEAARAIKRLGVGVKCATITSNQARMAEYKLQHLTPSPNAIIRAERDGTGQHQLLEKTDYLGTPCIRRCVQKLRNVRRPSGQSRIGVYRRRWKRNAQNDRRIHSRRYTAGHTQHGLFHRGLCAHVFFVRTG